MESIPLLAVLGLMVRLYGEKAPGRCYRSSFSKGICEAVLQPQWAVLVPSSRGLAEHTCEHPEGISRGANSC